MTAWAATFMAFAASASTKQQAIASLIVALVYVFQMVFSGLLVNLKGAWFRYLKYLSLFYYSMTALEINELKNLNISDFMIANTTGLNCIYGNKNAFFDAQGISYDQDFDLWVNIIPLAGIALLFMIIAYVQLRRVPKLK